MLMSVIGLTGWHHEEARTASMDSLCPTPALSW